MAIEFPKLGQLLKGSRTMAPPQFEIIPSYSAVRKDESVELDVLVRIHPPESPNQPRRPPLNVSLVLDRSGSMGADRKIENARQAAIFAVEQLLPTDRVSVIAFDTHVETLVPNSLAEDRAGIIAKIRGIYPRSSTALHQAWQEGAKQAENYLLAEGMNRVILLTDGLANVGITNTDVICSEIHRCKNRPGPSTTAFGMGDEYNEDLLEAMARSGDGNYYYIESSGQLPEFFQREFRELFRIGGESVTLGIEPQRHATLVGVLNDFDVDEKERQKLPNLIAGMPINVVVRLTVPPRAVMSEICRFRLEWNDPNAPGLQALECSLTLPTLVKEDWNSERNSVVAEQVAILLANREKLKAARAAERGDMATTMACLHQSREYVNSVPSSSLTSRELDQLGEIEKNLEEGVLDRFVRKAKSQVWSRQRSKE